MAGFDHYGASLQRFGNYKTGKACLYIKRLDDVDMPTLALSHSVEAPRPLYWIHPSFQ
jgi:hypothetical protein